jgi:outer membrane protein assembly factor BamB
MRVRTFVLLALASALLADLGAPRAGADDWPQWMGPKRDNVWREEGIIDKFPAEGAKIVWRTPIAGGFAGPAVANGKVYVTDRVLAKGARNPDDPFDTKKKINSTERVLCLDQKTGKEIWKHDYDSPYQISYPAGPRCTPTVHEGKVYTLGAMGHLFCFEADTGKVVWEKDLKKEYSAKAPLWGYVAHPLIDGKKLVTLAGGEGSHVVALDKDTGKEIWKAGSQPEGGQGYSPVLITEAAGKRQMIVVGTKSIYALNPETGEQYWTTPFETDSGCVVMTPIRHGDHVFIGAWNHKGAMLRLTADKPGVEVVWKNKEGHGLVPVNAQPFQRDGVVYGYDDDGNMHAVEIPSGKRLWEGPGPVLGEMRRGAEAAHIVQNGERFFFFADTGHLVIGKLSPKGYEETSRAKVIEPTGAANGRKVVWSAPAYADRKAFIRNDKEIICVDLAK